MLQKCTCLSGRIDRNLTRGYFGDIHLLHWARLPMHFLEPAGIFIHYTPKRRRVRPLDVGAGLQIYQAGEALPAVRS
jgi:hypothetical protein